MARPLCLAKVAWVILALLPLVQGCDSILGEARPSADGGACGIVYIYVDGGTAPVEVEEPVDGEPDGGEPDGGQGVSADGGGLATEIDGGDGAGAAIDTPSGVDQGTNPRDANSTDLDGALAPAYDSSWDLPLDQRADSPAPDAPSDIARDLPAADSSDSRLDSTVPHPEASPHI